jgi:hypothetical protein
MKKALIVAALLVLAAPAYATPLETYQALDDACRGESPSNGRRKSVRLETISTSKKWFIATSTEPITLIASGVRVGRSVPSLTGHIIRSQAIPTS